MSSRQVIAASAALALLGCGGASPSGPQDGGNQILATTSLQFTPAEQSVEPGSVVTWKFGAVAHTVQFDAVTGRPSDIAGAVANASVSRTFNQVGVFTYGCTIHPAMRGTVRVLAAGSAPPPPPPPPPPYPGY